MNKFDNSALIFKEGILDSMGFLKLITFIENEFDIQILDDDIMTVQRIAALRTNEEKDQANAKLIQGEI